MYTNVNRPSAVDVLRPFAVGDLFYADATTTLAKLPIGIAGQVLQVNATVPGWTSSIAPPGLTADRIVQTDSGGILTTPATVTTTQALVLQGATSVIDGNLSIVGSGDVTKTLRFETDAQSANCDLTFSTGAQTVDRTISVPVLTANATFSVLEQAQTFTAVNTFSSATPSTSPSTGAIVASAGGVGSAGSINAALALSFAGTGTSVAAGRTILDRSSTTTTRIIGCGPDNATAGQISLLCSSADASVIVTAFNLTATLLQTGATTDFASSSATEATSPTVAGTMASGGLAVVKRSFLGTVGSTFKGNVLAGVQDATADTAGAVGEVTQGTNQTSYTNFTTTNTYQQLAVLTSLAPGRYRIVGRVTYYGNGATVAAIADATFAISTTTASAAGAVEGRSLGYITQPVTSSTHITTSIDTDINISAATSYYLNGKANFTVGAPQYVASITAYRLR